MYTIIVRINREIQGKTFDYILCKAKVKQEKVLDEHIDAYNREVIDVLYAVMCYSLLLFSKAFFVGSKSGPSKMHSDLNSIILSYSFMYLFFEDF